MAKVCSVWKEKEDSSSTDDLHDFLPTFLLRLEEKFCWLNQGNFPLSFA